MVTPNCLASAAIEAVGSLSAMSIARASASVSLALPCAEPRGWLPRHFFSLSSMLSLCVPRKRWAGFTHSGLSHVCKTSSGPASTPLNKSIARRWACHDDCWNIVDPYPCDEIAPRHIQQPPRTISSLSINLIRAVAILKRPPFPQCFPISKYYNSGGYFV